MRLIYAVLLMLLTSESPLSAGILLGTPWASSGPNQASVSDSYAAVSTINIDPHSNATTVTIYYGTATITSNHTTAFTRDNGAPAIVWTLTWQTMTWTASNGVWAIRGTIAGADATALQTSMASGYIQLENELETLAISYGVLGSGTTNYSWSVTPIIN